MEAVRLGAGAEPIESMDWLHAFSERYLDAWNSHDPSRVTECIAKDVVWQDPALPQPAQGREEVAEFVKMTATAFPDYRFAEPGGPAISDDRLVAYQPWRMTGTNTGPIDPPGFAPTGQAFTIEGIDVWQFRGGLIWRYRAAYDFTEFGRQLGLIPPRESPAEKALVRMQRLQARFKR